MKIKLHFILLLIFIFTLSFTSCSKKYCSVGQEGTPGCPSYKPLEDPGSYSNIVLRTMTKENAGLEVSTSVLTDSEIEEVFGLDLAKDGIQPIWINIKNGSEKSYYLIKIFTDTHYFTPNEVATMSYVTFAIDVNKAINSYVNDNSLKRQIPANSEVSGFFYSNWDPGVKYIHIVLYSEEDVQNFSFYQEIPGLKLDYQKVDFDNIYEKDEFIELKNCQELTNALNSIPCCTQDKNGSGENDPLNFVVIGESEPVFASFLRQGWDVTESINIGSAWRAAKSFFTHERWRTSPMSSLFFYNRPQDIGLQKARSTIHERNHLRLWLTPYTYQGKNIWIGAVSRDVGSYFTWKTTWKTAHAIDPDIDEARNYLVQDLIYSQFVEEFGWVDQSIEPATKEEPHINFMEQPWWTDGKRAVFFFNHRETSLYDLKEFSCPLN